MYWSKLIFIFTATIVFANNDDLMLDAMLNENKNSEISSKAYEKLYNITKNIHYLENAIKQGIIANLDIKNLVKTLDNVDSKNTLLTKVKIIDLVEKKDYKNIQKIYYDYINSNEDISLSVALQEKLISDGLINEAYKISKHFYEKYNSPYSLYVYLIRLNEIKDYKKIIKLTDKIYADSVKNNKIEKEFYPYIQLRINALKELKQYDKLILLDNKAVLDYLKTLINNNNFDEILKITKNIEINEKNTVFLAFRAQAMIERLKKSDTKEIINLSKTLYQYTKEKTFMYGLAYFLIHFKNEKELEKIMDIDENLTFNILEELKKYKELSQILYNKALKTHDNKLLIKSYIFEMLADPKKFDYFKLDELVAKGGFDANMLNIYAYIIIDNKIDIQKGINLVKKALEIEPNNAYFIDTLAWGYYLLNDCNKAKEVFKQINIDDKLSKEKEIILHKKRIEKCKK